VAVPGRIIGLAAWLARGIMLHMSKVSAGLLLYRERGGRLEVLLGHPGGPFWSHKDHGVWTLPKGEVKPGEELLAAAQREFAEETGGTAAPPFIGLGSIQQKSGKTVHAWGFAGDFDPEQLHSGTYQMEWPPGSGRMGTFPEVDRVEFFPIAEARKRILAAQADFLDRLVEALVGQM
jgi:predicted NUDIX family NTP pyrophosphohydrolase